MAAEGADFDAGILDLFVEQLHEILAALLIERGDVEANHRAVVARSEPQVGREDGFLDRLYETAVPGLDDDEPRLGRADRGERDERARRSVCVDLELLDEARGGATGPHARELVFERIDRLAHPRLDLREDFLERHYLACTRVPMCSPCAARTIASVCEMSNTMMGRPRSSASAAAVASITPSFFSSRSRYVMSSHFFAPRTTRGSAS